MKQPNPKHLWEELATNIQWHHGEVNVLHMNDPSRSKALDALQELAAMFEGWESRYRNYRPICQDEHGKWVDGPWDVCAGLHLLKVAVELAQEVRRLHQEKERTAYWRQVAAAKIEAEGRTRH